MTIHIRKALDADLDQVLLVESLAFGQDDEAELVKNLLVDPSAKPLLSLLAFQNDRRVGHILFTKARLSNSQNDNIAIALLAPLAVIPEAQNQGIGGKLIEAGLKMLSDSGVALVFVLGYPKYYSSHGFQPAGCLGLQAPYPIAVHHADAWMVKALRANLLGSVVGKVICADALNQPEYWQE